MAFAGNDKGEVWRRLLPLAARDTRDLLDKSDVPSVSAFVARRREHFAELRLPTDGLVIVLEGAKEVRFGVDRQVYRPGEGFVALAGAAMDVTNSPDDRSGRYRALFIRLPRALTIEAARRWPQFVGPPSLEPKRLAVDAHLTEALAHAFACGGDEGPAPSPQLLQHRFLELALILAERGALALTPKYAGRSLADSLRQMFSHRLHHPWTAAEVSRRLGCSQATLRRRLQAEGESFAKVLLAERMAAARVLLAERGAEVADALAATGFSSRSHFASHYRRLYGEKPSGARRRQA
jgi:AraC-like DNA-binding protein